MTDLPVTPRFGNPNPSGQIEIRGRHLGRTPDARPSAPLPALPTAANAALSAGPATASEKLKWRQLVAASVPSLAIGIGIGSTGNDTRPTSLGHESSSTSRATTTTRPETNKTTTQVIEEATTESAKEDTRPRRSSDRRTPSPS